MHKLQIKCEYSLWNHLVDNLKGALPGKAPALSTNIRLGWKCWTVKNATAYF
jgi:hypothetical protein